MAKDTCYFKLQYIEKLAANFYEAEAYSEFFKKNINGFQLLTSLAKSFTSEVLQGYEYAFFHLTININKPYIAKTNHRRTLKQAAS